MRDFWIEPEKKKANKKKIIITIIIGIIIIASIVTAIIYYNNEEAREWIDTNIFRKEVLQNNATTVEIKEVQSSNIYAFNRYIGILNKNTFNIYSNSGNKEKELEIQVSNPLFDSANRFLVIGETKGQKLYVIEDRDIAWETTIEGNIAQVHINKNGYVAVVVSDTSYKTVIELYDSSGKRLFKTFSSTRATDVSISNDNKYLAIAEVDTSGTMIQSSIKIQSIEAAANDSEESIIKTYNGEQDKLLVNINYQDKDKLVCMYTDSIRIIENEQDNVLVDNKDKKVIFQTVELENNVASIEEKSSGLFTADTVVNITNTDNKETKQYIAQSLAKDVYSYENIIALNLGTEIEFINTSGWLVKRYKANQEITNIAVSNNIAAIIYRDKIEIISL